MIFKAPEWEKNLTADNCDTFAWIGQDFAFCDRCGRPYWVHKYEPGYGSKWNERGKISQEKKESAYRNWHPDRRRRGGIDQDDYYITLKFESDRYLARPCIAIRDRQKKCPPSK